LTLLVLQTIVNNFISGIIILFESYLRIGDVIELESGKRGEILEINFRSTTIRTVDGTDLLLPNSLLIDRGVTNWTLADPYRRLHAAFSTSYGVDKEFIAKIISEGAKEVASTIMMPVKPNPVVRLTKLGDYGLEFELIVWVDEGVNARSSSSLSDYLWMIDTVLAKNKIEIPSRQLDIHLIAKKDSDLT
jgi:potassium efflux system protein